MSEAFISEIRIFPFGVVPEGWMQCNGQMLPIQQYQAMYSLLGNTYGGDGRITFALPDLRGRTPIASSMTQTTPSFPLGAKDGTETVTLSAAQTPSHNHSFVADNRTGVANLPGGGNNLATAPSSSPIYAASGPSTGGLAAMDPQSIGPAGQGAPHPNMQPFLVLNFCICMQGIYPLRP